ncbi:MAG: hypothetical protein HZA53_14875 [Planctomycetes bacterium]|nr:hypothetical protein [Planctomycetota bacterium]
MTPDERRAFVAAGAGISVLDVETIQNGVVPAILDRVEIPDCAPEAMVYHQPKPDTHYLYVAGGTLGLWRVQFCPALFGATPLACEPTYYTSPSATRAVRMAIADENFKRKRCVDLCIVPDNVAAGAPLLFALFASRADSGIGASELHAFLLDANGGYAPYGPSTPLEFTAPAENHPAAAATAITADPGDPNFVYVAPGKGGILRVDISTAAFQATKVSRPECALSSCPDGEAIRDLAVVRTATQGSFLYAAAEYAGLLEYRIPAVTLPAPDPSHPSMWTAQTLTGVNRYAERVAACTSGGDYIYVAVGSQSGSAIESDTPAPHRNRGHWNGLCIDWFRHDSNSLGGVAGADQVVLLGHDGANPSLPAYVVDQHAHAKWWGSLLLRRRSPSSYRLYECTSNGATVGRQLDITDGNHPPGIAQESWTTSGTHLDFAAAVGDGLVSLVNPNLVFFGPDGPASPANTEGFAFVIEPTAGGEDLRPVLGTDRLCASAPSASAPCGEAPNPYTIGLLQSAQWVDPFVPTREWFFSGDDLLEKWQSSCQAPASACDNPCEVLWRGVPTAGEETPANSSQGYRVAAMKLDDVDRDSLPTWMKWWQMETPSDVPSARADAIPYNSAAALPMLDAVGFPLLVAGVRSGSMHGIKLFRPADIRPRGLNDFCNTNQATPGVGEVLYQTTSGYPPHSEQISHPEFEQALPQADRCVPWVECAVQGIEQKPRTWYNSQCDFFERLDQQGNPRWACVVTAGFVAASPNAPDRAMPSAPANANGPQPSTCLWDEDYGRAIIAIYDVHDAATSVAGSPMPAPQLLRYGLGPVLSTYGQTHAWAVRTKYYSATGKTYAFVSDVLGKLFVYDISSGPGDPLSMATIPDPAVAYRGNYPVLAPVATISFPADAGDGFDINLTDIEIDGDFAYCALARAGLGVVDISNPLEPQVQLILDTPGLALGLAVRSKPGGEKQLVVGDSVCGVRIYGRTGTGNP